MDENAFASLSLDGTMEAAEVCDDVPPLPSPMRRKPNKRMVGTGKAYTSTAEFEADLARWNEEHAARQLRVKQRDRHLEQQRDRSGRQQDRQQLSGAQHRRQYDQGLSQAEADSRQRERSRARYYKRAEQLKQKAAASSTHRPALIWYGKHRRDAEMELLGERFVDDGQRVRITASGYLHGRCGTVVSRALLCEEDAQKDQVTSRPPKNAAGRYELPEGRRHLVRLDVIDGSDDEDGDDGTMLDTDGSSNDGGSSSSGGSSDSESDSDGGLLLRLAPHEVEPWPRIGQRVLMPSVAGDDRQVGLVDAYCSDWSYGIRDDGTYGPDMRPHRGCYVCVTAEHTLVLPPTMFKPIEDNDASCSTQKPRRSLIRNVSVAAAAASAMAAAAVVAVTM